MSLLTDEKCGPFLMVPGDTITFLWQNDIVLKHNITKTQNINRVRLYDDADPEFFKNGYRLEFGESK